MSPRWPIVGLLWLALVGASPVAADVATGAEVTRAILAHGPWPRSTRVDPSNRASGVAAAMVLGERLFFDAGLSRDGDRSCASCHQPQRWFTDGRARGIGTQRLDRNTPSVVDLAGNRWFGWGGASDSLWAQSLRPITASKEMDMSVAGVGAYVRGDAGLACGIEQVFEVDVDTATDETLFVAVGKALAAYQETLVSGRSPFDAFRDALAAGDEAAMRRYPVEARRGLELFVGRGRCNLCHFGATFSNGEFASVGVPFFTDGGVDPGRYGGILALRGSPFTRLGAHADRPETVDATSTRHVALRQSNYGQFRVPPLRNVARTAPYMHDGSLATLEDVVRHYSELDEDRIHAHGDQVLRRLDLSDDEVSDLVAFLRSLTSPLVAREAASGKLGVCG